MNLGCHSQPRFNPPLQRQPIPKTLLVPSPIHALAPTPQKSSSPQPTCHPQPTCQHQQQQILRLMLQRRRTDSAVSVHCTKVQNTRIAYSTAKIETLASKKAMWIATALARATRYRSWACKKKLGEPYPNDSLRKAN